MNQAQYNGVKATLTEHLENATESIRTWERRMKQDQELIEEFGMRAAGFEDALILLATYAMEKGLTP